MKKNIRLKIFFLGIYAILMTMRYFQTVVGMYNTTLLAFSYQYGFISRGLVGTCFQWLDRILPWDMYTYRGAQMFSFGLHLMFLMLLLVFFWYCLSKSERLFHTGMLGIMFIFATFAFPEFVTFENMGRVDSVMAILTLAGVFLVIAGKFEWMLIPLAAAGVCIHQGYVLMFISIFIVLLTAKAIDHRKKGWGKYAFILIFMVLTAAVLFLYFNYFSHEYGEEIYPKIYERAQAISADGGVHKQLMDHEILGENPAADEWTLHLFNFREILVFGILVLPYIWILMLLFGRCVKEASGFWQKIKYLVLLFGGDILLLPDFAMKIDYGRWVFCIIFYYAIVILALVANGDQLLCRHFYKIFCQLKKWQALCILLLLYPTLLTPLGDIWITELSKNLTKVVFRIPGDMLFF